VFTCAAHARELCGALMNNSLMKSSMYLLGEIFMINQIALQAENSFITLSLQAKTACKDS